jgi:hypothetical protein
LKEEWVKIVEIQRKGSPPKSMGELKKLLREYHIVKGDNNGSLQYESQLAYVRHKYTNYNKLYRKLKFNDFFEHKILQERANKLAEEILSEIRSKGY